MARVVLAGRRPTTAPTRRSSAAVAVGGAGWRARGCWPPCPPTSRSPHWLAEQAESLAEETGLKATVWDEHGSPKDGFGGIIGVGRGVGDPPCLIRLDYTPRDAAPRRPRVVLVGKGITFDSGGLSIKPAEAMRR